MSVTWPSLLVGLVVVSVGVFAAQIDAGQQPANPAGELINNAGWECVQGAKVADGTLVLRGGTAGFSTVNDNEIRLETGAGVTVALTLQANASEQGFAGLSFWNELPPPGDAANWYATAAKVQIGIQGGRASLRVFDGN